MSWVETKHLLFVNFANVLSQVQNSSSLRSESQSAFNTSWSLFKCITYADAAGRNNALITNYGHKAYP
jgi:hypothetical protein